MMRPTSPFAVTWYFLGPSDTGGGPTGGGPSSSGSSGKSSKVQGIFSYRNPMGVLGVCPEVVQTPSSNGRCFKQGLGVYGLNSGAEEVYAVAVAQQNKDSVSQAWAEGVTVLPQREAALLMLAFLPSNSSIEIVFKASQHEPVSISSIELMDGMHLSHAAHAPVITVADLLRANVVRHLLSKALHGDTAAAAAAGGAGGGGGGGGGGRGGGRRPSFEALLGGQEQDSLQMSLKNFLGKCNQPISPAEVDELVIAGGP
ncbi:hypothetical protein ACSSS7_003596 [Eimeria intestinalis]